MFLKDPDSNEITRVVCVHLPRFGEQRTPKYPSIRLGGRVAAMGPRWQPSEAGEVWTMNPWE